MRDYRFGRMGRDDGFFFERGKYAFGVHRNQDLLLRQRVILIRQEQRIKSFCSLPKPNTTISFENFLQDDLNFFSPVSLIQLFP